MTVKHWILSPGYVFFKTHVNPGRKDLRKNCLVWHETYLGILAVFRLLFIWIFFLQFGKLFGSFFYFFLKGVLGEREDISMKNMSISCIFLIFISDSCWNNFWCTKRSWTVLKKPKTTFYVLFGKIEGRLQKYHLLILTLKINSYKSLL